MHVDAVLFAEAAQSEQLDLTNYALQPTTKELTSLTTTCARAAPTACHDVVQQMSPICPAAFRSAAHACCGTPEIVNERHHLYMH